MFIVEIWGIPASVDQAKIRDLVNKIKQVVSCISSLNKSTEQVRVRIPAELLNDNPDKVLGIDVSRVYHSEYSPKSAEGISRSLFDVVVAFAKECVEGCKRIEIDVHPFESRLYDYASYDLEGNLHKDRSIKPIPEAK